MRGVQKLDVKIVDVSTESNRNDANHAWYLFSVKKDTDPSIQGIFFKMDMTGPRVKRYFHIIHSISFDSDREVKLSICGLDKTIRSGEVLDVPHIGTYLTDITIEGVDKYTVTGIVYEDDLWSKECAEKSGMFSPVAYGFK